MKENRIKKVASPLPPGNNILFDKKQPAGNSRLCVYFAKMRSLF